MILVLSPASWYGEVRTDDAAVALWLRSELGILRSILSCSLASSNGEVCTDDASVVVPEVEIWALLVRARFFTRKADCLHDP